MNLLSKLKGKNPTKDSEVPDVADGRENIAGGNFGLFTLHDASPEADNAVDVIAIHGLGGNWRTTWTSAKGKTWLRDFLPIQLQDSGISARVLSFGYDADSFFGKANLDIDDVAGMLVEYMDTCRQSQNEKRRPIILVAHSLGGVVTKRAISLCHERQNMYGHLLRCITGIVFFAVPHRGADIAYWGLFAQRLLHYSQFTLRGNSEFLKGLQTNSKTFAAVSQQFVERAQQLQILTLVESERMGNQVIVERNSAVLLLPNEKAITLPASNHRTICRFDDLSDQRYVPVWRNLVVLARDALQTRLQGKRMPADAVEPESVLDTDPTPDTQGSSVNQCKYTGWREPHTAEETVRVLKGLEAPQSPPAVPDNMTMTSTATVTRASGDVPSYTILQKTISVSKFASWLSLFGLFGSMIRKTEASQTEMSISMRWLVPRYRGKRKRNWGIAADFIFYHYFGDRRQLKPGICPGLRYVNVIRESADIAIACGNGDLAAARRLFAAKSAHVHDVTTENMTLLSLAVGSGNTKLVKFLLDIGAEVNWTFGRNQTTAIQWAVYRGHVEITRLLVNCGADGGHVSAEGSTLFHFLLEGARAHLHRPKLSQFLLLLADERLVIDLETENLEGYSALDQAASWYPAEVILRLLALGAPMARFGRDPWSHIKNPIWYAIHSGNVSSFEALLPYYSDVNAKDHLEMMMISYTARYGRERMTELLLSRGALEIYPEYDAQVEVFGHEAEQSSDSDDSDDEGIGYCDEDEFPDDGLKPWTAENYNVYMRALRRFDRVVVQVDESEDSETPDVFWDAVETWRELN